MRTAVVGLVLLFGWAVIGLSQVSSSAASSAFGDEPVRVSIGTFLFEVGQALALEITREEPCPCLCDELSVEGFRVLDSGGNVVYEDEGGYPISAEEWVGIWTLMDGTGALVPPGEYTAVIATSAGEFRAQLLVVAPGERPSGHSLAQASVCGLELLVYRLVGDGDEGKTVVLDEGERLMVALPGNPTTGYQWVQVEVPAFLQALPGVEYRPVVSPIPVGGGGTFYFRFLAKEAGEGAVSFAYRRPWEAQAPAREFSITVIVRGWPARPTS